MPDLTLQPYYHCESAEHFVTEVVGSKGDKYTVRWDNYSHKNRREVDYDYSCTCMAYKTRPGDCKHIKQVKESKKHCNWLQFIDGGEPKNGRCPRCGSEVHSQMWGV